MDIFLDILTRITAPIVALMALGWIAQHYLLLDAPSLSRMLVNVVLPCAFVHFLTTADLPLAAVWPTVWFTILSFGVLLALGWAIAAPFDRLKGSAVVIGIAAAFPNTGNYGIALAQLAFEPDYLLHQTVIVCLHSILIVLAGVWLLDHQRKGAGAALQALLRSPMIIAIAAGLLLKSFEVTLPPLLGEPLRIMAGAYTPLALFTLGVQLAGAQVAILRFPVILSTLLKLLVAPALTWIMCVIFGFPDGLTDVLVVAAAAPVGVLLAIFCAEYDRAPNLASATVLLSTVLSPLIVTAWLLAVRLY
ncbi:MAG: AEC family transporter [Pseudomonadota bacterium]|nr:AEC family transporter [Pseudomonadota bacterium]